MAPQLTALIESLNVSWLTAFLEVVLKTTVVLGAAFLLNLALRRASAATRHFVWSLALATALVLPALSLVLPAWRLTLPSRPVLAAPAAPAQVSSAPGASGASGAVRSALPQAAGAPSALPSPAEADSPGRRLFADGATLLLLAWSAGALLVIVRLLAGLLGVRRLTRRASPVVDAGWLALASDLEGRMGLSEAVRLLSSDRTTVPVTWGWLRHAVLLPRNADAWSPAQRRAVLLHELAHVKRRDCLVQLLVQLACSFYWWNPLVWMAAHRMRIERERACDDAVLSSGTRPSEYASFLLEVARSVKLSPVVALAMAHPSQLEGRLLAILDPNPRPRRLSRLAAACCLAGMIGLVLPLAALEVSSADDEAASALAASGGSAPARQGEPAEWTFAVSPGRTLFLDSDLPVRGTVRVTSWDRNETRVSVRKGFDGSEAQAAAGLRQVSVETRQSGGDVYVETSRGAGSSELPGGLRLQYEIQVPRSFNLDLDVANGVIEVADLRGNVRASTGAGNVTIGRIRDGSVHAKTSGGGIYLQEVENGDGELESSGGPISVGSVSGRLKVATGGGKVTVKRSGTNLEAQTEGGEIRIEEARGSVDARSGSGRVEARLAASAARGPVVCSLETSSADVILHLPENLKAAIATELRVWQEKDGRLGDPSREGHQVYSDFPLTQAAPRVVEEDATKRISLLASGTDGGGQARIRLATINGDIHIRKY